MFYGSMCKKKTPIETYFISGHLDLSDEEFEEYYVPQIESALSETAHFVVADRTGESMPT